MIRMGTSAALALTLGLPALAAAPTATAPEDSTPTQDVPEIVVAGEHAGPRLWRVSSGDHVVWVLGTVSPLPKGMVWQSHGVQQVLAESSEVIPGWPAFGIGANPITAIRVYWQWRQLQKMPDHGDLRQVLPPPLYARFESLRQRYAPGDSGLERLRPMVAGERLMAAALDRSGLTLRNEVQQTVLKMAHRQGVTVHQDKMRVQDPLEVLKDVAAAPTAGEIACLQAIVTRLETDLPAMQSRARAWALGDVESLRRLPPPDDRTACLAAVSTSDRVRNLIAQASNDWLVSVEDSLRRNRTALAVQSMDRLLGEQGSLALLRRRGYGIEGP